MRKAIVFIVSAFLLMLAGTPVYANGIPPLPHAFYGNVAINGSPAPIGTTVEARGEGVLTGIEGNPITTTQSGKYGSTASPELDLIVQGDITSGAIITFYVKGHLATTDPATVEWHSGETTEVNLSVTITEPGPGPGPSGLTIDTSLFDVEGEFPISDEGEILETIEATSEDGELTITIPEGTIALDENDDPLEIIEVVIDDNPPDPPEDASIIGLAYDFGPDGATFDPPITFEYTYDPDDLPEGVAEEDLVLAWYNEDTGEWEELTCTVDTENNTITASVSHFTTFAIIGTTAPAPAPAAFTPSSLVISPTEVAPGEEVTISLSVANTGGVDGSYTVVLKIDEVKEAEETVTIAAGSSEDVSFSVTKEKAGSYSVSVDGLSGSFTVVPVVVPPEPAAFSVSSLSVLPAEVEPGEAVTIAVSVANTGGESGSYTVVLKIDGVKEAEETITVAAGESQDVSFSMTREEADTYAVAVDGLSGSFTVVAPVVVPLAKPGINWPLIGGIIGGVIVVGLGVFFWMRRRAY